MERILDIIESIAYEKGLKIEDVKGAVREALLKTAKKTLDKHINYDVEIDEKSKSVKLYQIVTICPDDDERLKDDPDNHLSVSEAKKVDENLEVEDELKYELSLENMTRTAANTLHKELEFHIQRTLENQLFAKYKSKVGKIVHGSVVRVDDEENTYIEMDEIRAIMPKKNRIKGEKFKIGDVVNGVLRSANINKSTGIDIEISRTTPKYLEELLFMEVPEIKDGDVIVHKVARIPGERAKIALSSITPKIDPIGATVGVRGVRINAISKELKGENIDCIEYSPIPEIFVARALSPAVISNVKLEDGKATVTVNADQKPKAIGKGGINVRLASMLTGFEIEFFETEGIAGKKEDSNSEQHDKAKDLASFQSLFKD